MLIKEYKDELQTGGKYLRITRLTKMDQEYKKDSQTLALRKQTAQFKNDRRTGIDT